MTPIHALTLFSLLISSTISNQPKTHKVKIVSSEISIQGTTNINEFDCILSEEGQNDELDVYSQWSEQRLDFEGLTLSFDIDRFDCGLKVMNTDFQEILHAEQFPKMKLIISSIEIPLTNNQIERLHVNSDVSVEIAGVNRHFSVTDGRIINKSAEELVFEGSQIMHITDFGITPPVKYHGMVKVDDQIVVHFSVSMKVKTYR